jgi:hypothetical protein
MVMLIPEYKISIFLSIAIHLFLEKLLDSYPDTRIAEQVSVAL